MTGPVEASVLLELAAALSSIGAVAGTVFLVDRVLLLPWRRPRRVIETEGRRLPALRRRVSSIPGLSDVSGRRELAGRVSGPPYFCSRSSQEHSRKVHSSVR